MAICGCACTQKQIIERLKKFPEEFFGETIVLRRGFLFNTKKIKTLKKVGLVSSKFEKTFNAYGTDQVEDWKETFGHGDS